MYQVNIQTKNGWEFMTECETKQELDFAIQLIIQRHITRNIQVLEDNIYLTRVGCDDYSYFYFKNKYILDKGLDFDVIKEYHKQLKK